MSLSRSETGRAAPRVTRRVVDVLTRVELALAGLATVVIFVLVLVQAGQRYLPLQGWSWTGELSRYCLVWLTFTAAGVLVTRDDHISLQLVDSIKVPLVARFVRTFSCLVVAAVGLGLTIEAWELVSTQGPLKTPSLRMPMSWVYVLPLIGFVSTTVRALFAAVMFAVRGAPEHGDHVEVVPE